MSGSRAVAAFCVMALCVCGCRDEGGGGVGLQSSKSGSLMVRPDAQAPCRRMCQHVSDCRTHRQGQNPARVRGTQIYREMMNECMYGCVGKVGPEEVACWTAAPCVKAGKLGALSGACRPPSAKIEPPPPPPPKAPPGPDCQAMCAHVTACAEARPKGLTDAEVKAECMFRCEPLEPPVRACYAASPCVDLPLVSGLSAGACVGMAPRRCVESRLCLDEGKCTLAKGRCVQTKESVAGSRMCTVEGRCGGRAGRSRPRNQRDCREADVCRDEGRCRRGKTAGGSDYISCLASGSGCAKTEACREDGVCGAHPRWRQCVPTAGGCARSEQCKEFGLCGARKTRDWKPAYKHLECVVSASGCRGSETCKRTGRCWARPSKFDEGSCVSKGIADCRRICAGVSDCTFVYADRRCVPRSTNACRAMHGGGAGTWIFAEGKCVPQSDADCVQSWACRGWEGRCSHRDGRCVLATDADCARRKMKVPDAMKRTRFDSRLPSKEPVNGCAEFGQCTFDEGRCVVSEEGCAASKLCLEDGLCSVGPDGCFAASDADCAKSRLCQRNGACIALEGRCTFRCGNGPEAGKCAH